MTNNNPLNRRTFITATSAAALAASLPSTRALAKPKNIPIGKAEHCIFLWLGGGAGQIDTFDPKALGDNTTTKKPGSLYPSIDTAIPSVKICEHMPRTAKLYDRCAPVRTVFHDIATEHAAATNRMHTGRKTSGTIIYPSIGSIVSHELGPIDPTIPPYVIVGYPNVTRGPGFLGAEHDYLYLLDTETGPTALTQPDHITSSRQARREKLLGSLRDQLHKNHPNDPNFTQYDTTLQRAAQLSGPQFMDIFNLKEEAPDLRAAYGQEFGQRCLLARRLIQKGVRFVEVAHNLNFMNGTGWDVHRDGIHNQHLLIQELDNALATLITDLENHHLLDKTLIVVSTEFGRPAAFDSVGGRGHQAEAFSTLLAGASLNTGQAIGTTDHLAKKILDQPVSIPDLFATIFWALGINPHKELYDTDRPVPITDHGNPIAQLFT